jgi:hypothetical protein
MSTISSPRSFDHGLDHAQEEYFAISGVAEGGIASSSGLQPR